VSAKSEDGKFDTRNLERLGLGSPNAIEESACFARAVIDISEMSLEFPLALVEVTSNWQRPNP
jgi:hypothetical protein